ncbi:helix-turn-helix domain-containing protein [Tessaracoccus lapidicaptus]|uniref:helix-turn-helix domain-containing protein n=1 Tax=Tessaracoccus lapidicaptus TaxID=1427523 RepID=UPI003340E9C8
MGYTPPPSSSPDHYLTLQEAVSRGYGAYQTLRKWIADGRLPAVKIGSRVKVLQSDLDALAVAIKPSTFEDIEASAERLAASAPTLTDAQVRRLTAIFGGAS